MIVLKENPNVECHYITEKEIVGGCVNVRNSNSICQFEDIVALY